MTGKPRLPWMPVPSPATSCSQWDRTPRPAGPATHRATWTSRCAIARLSSMGRQSCAAGRSSRAEEALHMGKTTTFRPEEAAVFERQGFGSRMGVSGAMGLLIVDFVVGFADPALFGGGNIAAAIFRTREL